MPQWILFRLDVSTFISNISNSNLLRTDKLFENTPLNNFEAPSISLYAVNLIEVSTFSVLRIE